MIYDSETTHLVTARPQRSSWRTYGAVIFFCGIALVFGIGSYLDTAPDAFPVHSEFAIASGSSMSAIGTILYEQGYIRSPLLFKLYVRGKYPDAFIKAGNYSFGEAVGMRTVVDTLMTGEAVIPERALTFPEGFTVYDIRTYTKDAFVEIDIEQAIPYEGYLFPDTYFVSSHETFDDLITRMRDEYEAKIAPLRAQIASSGLTEAEVITLASIVEREANNEQSMRMVAGVLRNRLEDGLPLQVDAVFEYLLGKTSEELTIEDLEMDSPYNTYTNLGLPPTPISNPGLMAINAVLDPIPSDYHFYLTGNDGNFYYATTFEEHKRNKARYLR